MTSFRKKKKTLHESAKEIARCVIKVCDEEARTGMVQFCLNQRNMRASNYTGISRKSISKIRKECREAGPSKLPTPGKHRPRALSTVAHIDYFGIHVVRSTIKDFYLLQKGKPNTRKLLEAIREKVDFPWSTSTLRMLLKDLGYRWKKRRKNTHVLVENPHIITCRFRYLESIRKFREQNLNIIYVGETCVSSNSNCKKYWLSRDSLGSQTNCSPSYKKLSILHATGIAGFIKDSLIIFKGGQLVGDSELGTNGQINCEMFEKWLTEVVLPNIPEKSVIVLGSLPFNSVELNRAPTDYNTKAAMKAWLEKNNISFCPDMYRFELYNLIKQYKSNEKTYYIDELLKINGHMVLRLPRYTFELNPAEFAWDKVENKITEKNLGASSTADELEKAVIEGMNSLTTTDWKSFYSNVIKIENYYWDTDEAMDTKMEKYIVSFLHSDLSDSATDSESETV